MNDVRMTQSERETVRYMISQFTSLLVFCIVPGVASSRSANEPVTVTAIHDQLDGRHSKEVANRPKEVK